MKNVKEDIYPEPNSHKKNIYFGLHQIYQII